MLWWSSYWHQQQQQEEQTQLLEKACNLPYTVRYVFIDVVVSQALKQRPIWCSILHTSARNTMAFDAKYSEFLVVLFSLSMRLSTLG